MIIKILECSKAWKYSDRNIVILITRIDRFKLQSFLLNFGFSFINYFLSMIQKEMHFLELIALVERGVIFANVRQKLHHLQ